MILILDHNGSGEDGKSLAESLMYNRSVARLNLSNNGIGDEGAKAFALVLQQNTTLTSLNLSGKYLNINSGKIGTAGGLCLLDAMRTNTSLTELFLEGNKDMSKEIKNEIIVLVHRNQNPGAGTFGVGAQLSSQTIMDDTTSVISEQSTPSYRFDSIDPLEIGEKLRTCIEKHMRGSGVEVILSEINAHIRIQLNHQQGTNTNSLALKQTIRRLLGEILLQSAGNSINDDVIILSLHSLTSQHVNLFTRIFLSVKGDLLKEELEAVQQGIAQIREEVVLTHREVTQNQDAIRTLVALHLPPVPDADSSSEESLPPPDFSESD